MRFPKLQMQTPGTERNIKHWVGLKVHLDLSVASYGKNQTNFLANLIHTEFLLKITLTLLLGSLAERTGRLIFLGKKVQKPSLLRRGVC